MSYKLCLARWIANRIARRNRAERRSLRDYQRQELGRLRCDEKRVRGLRLYVAWSRRHRTAITDDSNMGWSRAVQQASP